MWNPYKNLRFLSFIIILLFEKKSFLTFVANFVVLINTAIKMVKALFYYTTVGVSTV